MSMAKIGQPRLKSSRRLDENNFEQPRESVLRNSGAHVGVTQHAKGSLEIFTPVDIYPHQ